MAIGMPGSLIGLRAVLVAVLNAVTVRVPSLKT